MPLAQDTDTLTGAALFGTKSLATMNEVEFREFVIVQEGVPPTVTTTSAQFSWLAV